MALANLLWQHPTGDPVWVPCSHLSLTQTGSFSLDVPTKVDLEPLHQPNDGMTPLGPIPCIHLKPVVTMSTTSIPKYEVTAQHPNGHDSGTVAPCAHPMLPCLLDSARGLVFFTDDAQFQQVTVELVDDLRGRLHVRTVGAGTRPLLLFFREAVRGNADDDTDPFWSHYDPALHAIQITRRPGAVNYDDVRSTLRHELGHAIVGQSCVQVPNEGDPHSLKRPSHPGRR
jgi:hypothetical protein